METEIFETLGKVAGIGGVVVGSLTLIFRDVIAKNIFSKLTKEQSYKLLRLILILTWSVAVIGISAWLLSGELAENQSVEVNINDGSEVESIIIDQSSGVSEEAFRSIQNQLQIKNAELDHLISIVEEKDVPREKRVEKLEEIAQSYIDLKSLVKNFESEDPDVSILQKQARSAIDEMRLSDASKLIREAKLVDNTAIESLYESLLHRKKSSAASEALIAKIYETELNYSSAVRSYNDAIDILPENQEKLLAGYLHSKAELLRDMGKLKDTESLYKSIIDLKLETYGPASSELAKTLVSFAWLYHDEHEYKKSKGLLDQALSIYKDSSEVSKEHGNALSSTADVYRHLFMYEESEKLYVEAFTMVEESSGLASDEYFSLLNNYSQLLMDIDRLDEAKEKLLQAKKIAIDLYRENHPELVAIYNNLAGVYWRKKDYQEAIRYLKFNHKLQEKYYGELSFNTALSASNIATVYGEMKKYDESKEYFDEALRVFDDWSDKPEIFYSIVDQYQNALFSLGKFDEAIALNKELQRTSGR